MCQRVNALYTSARFHVCILTFLLHCHAHSWMTRIGMMEGFVVNWSTIVSNWKHNSFSAEGPKQDFKNCARKDNIWIASYLGLLRTVCIFSISWREQETTSKKESK